MPKPKASSKPKTPAAASQPAPAWPPFKPPLPVVALAPALHPATPRVALVPSFFPRALCRDYVAFLRTLPLQTTPARPRRGDAAFARRLWEQTGLREALLEGGEVRDLWGGEPIGLSPNIRVYRYSKGQYFDCHYDDHNDLILPTQPPTPARTTWTLLLYLTSAAEGCVGGETVFYSSPRDRRSRPEEIVVPPETGMLLLHKHGDDCLLHEGREVMAGEKWVLRTDICIRR